jgi:beta-glucosidase/6-phospho-beta-glucosidase/beta-galactosidase
LGLNYYTAELVTPIKLGEESTCLTNTPGWNRDLGTDRIRDPNGKLCGIWWQRDFPRGLRNTLQWIKKQYGNPPVIITENGMSASDDKLDDDDRVEFFKGHINELLKAVKLDGCNVEGYLGWCLLDVWEWADGYTYVFM